MSGVRVSADWTFRGLVALVLENALVRVVVLPELGGKVWSLVSKPTDTELLWTNPRVPPRPVPFGATYDDAFSGGWDELYPNDEAEELAGEPLPDHGEIWTLPWQWTTGQDADQAWIELTIATPITTTAVTKRLVLAAGAATVQTHYRLRNTGPVDQPYLWKSHVAVALHPDSRVDLGARTVLLHDFGRPRARGAEAEFDWPHLVSGADTHDMRTLPAADSGRSEFLLSTAMRSGFARVDHPSAGLGLELTFDLADLPSVWTFASYGGWRGLHVLVLEPCTGHPLSVAEGVAAGTHQTLRAGEERRWTLTATVVGG